jgi:hypothetical protein
MIRMAITTGCWLALAASTTLTGGAGPPQQQRTASWYADHPSVLERVTKLCRDDPGHAVHNPDCLNASQAQVIIALRETDQHNSTDLTPPSNPHYWKMHPGELSSRLAICDRASADARAALWCPSAYEAAGRSK